MNIAEDMDGAITIVVGAGAVLDFEHKGIVPSVKRITEEDETTKGFKDELKRAGRIV